LFYRDNPAFPVFMGIAVLLVGFIIFQHRSNIRRLLKGEEHTFTGTPRRKEHS